MKLREIIIILLVSIILTWLYLWWSSKDWILDVGPGFCPYPDLIYPIMRPICLRVWWYNAQVFIISLISVSVIWFFIKKLISKAFFRKG